MRHKLKLKYSDGSWLTMCDTLRAGYSCY